MRRRLSILLLLTSGLLSSAKGNDEAASLDISPITETRLKAHVSFLASDALEGRDTAQRGGEIAGLYLASQFQSLGLVAVGAEDDLPDLDLRRYHQAFKLAGSKFDNVVLSVGDRSFNIGRDFLLFPGSGGSGATAELVFCGYGITAPEFEYDDYAGVDVKGKIALVLRHEPDEKGTSDWFRGKTHSRHALFTSKYDNARKHGAVNPLFPNPWSGPTALLRASLRKQFPSSNLFQKRSDLVA